MLPYERKKAILEFVENNDETNIDAICDLLNDVSVSTVRRDLKRYEDEGHISIFYGGIIKKADFFSEESVDKKRDVNVEAKKRIAKYAASLVKPNSTVFIDGGTTCADVISYLDESIRVITTSIEAVKKNTKNLSLYLIGGDFSNERSGTYGASTIDQIKYMSFEFAFLGANCVNEKFGVCTPLYEEALAKRAVIKNSKYCYFLIDSSKFGGYTTNKVCSIDECKIITENSNIIMEEHSNIIVINDR